MRNVLLTAIVASIPLVRAHISFYDTSMWGFNVTMQTFSYDNRPMAPLQQYPFSEWWFHGHLSYPPDPGYFFELPAGGVATSQLACNKGATKFWASSEGSTDIRQNGYPCPGYPTSQFHGIDDLKGCALSIAYTSDIDSLQPEDLAVFSVVHQCVWTVDTQFQIPQNMPPCPDDGCICAWHWIHSVDSGSAQMYMNGFRCKVTGSTSNSPIMTPQVPKRCTGDLSQCNQGAQQPLYWFQTERNNMFNDQYDPPYYLDEWGFTDGPQNGIFDNGSNANSSNVNAVPPSSSSSTSSSSTPSSTPLSTPSPTPTPSNNTPAQSNDLAQGDPQDDGSNGGSSPSPSPTTSPVPPQSSSPSPNGSNGTPSNSSNNGSDEMDPSNSTPPSSSGSLLCRNRSDKKKRQTVASRHFKHRRHTSRQHH